MATAFTLEQELVINAKRTAYESFYDMYYNKGFRWNSSAFNDFEGYLERMLIDYYKQMRKLEDQLNAQRIKSNA